MYRIFVEWSNGDYLNSLNSDFHNEMNELIRQYGLPIKVELRGEDEWINGGQYVDE